MFKKVVLVLALAVGSVGCAPMPSSQTVRPTGTPLQSPTFAALPTTGSVAAATAAATTGPAASVTAAQATQSVAAMTPTKTTGSVAEVMPAAATAITVDLTDKMDDEGRLLEAVEVVSSDRRAKLSLAKGTKILNASGRAVKSITVTSRPTRSSESTQAILSGVAYEFGNLAVRPEATLTISYDPPSPNSRINLQEPQLGFWDVRNEVWVKPSAPVEADPKAHTVSVSTGSAASFVILFWYANVTPPIS